jgi:hypothetical protein
VSRSHRHLRGDSIEGLQPVNLSMGLTPPAMTSAALTGSARRSGMNVPCV